MEVYGQSSSMVTGLPVRAWGAPPRLYPESVSARSPDSGIGELFGTVRHAVARTGRIVLWNPSTTTTFRHLLSEALGMNIEQLIPDARGLGLRKTGEEIRVKMSPSLMEKVHHRGVANGGAKGRFALAIT